MAFHKSQSAGYLANHMARLFAREIHAAIKPLGLSPGNFPAMLELWGEDGLTQRKLVERLNIEQATMANTLNRMERDGLVRRIKDDDDGRVQRVWLTDTGRALHQPAVTAAQSVNQAALSGLSDAEISKFISVMKHVIGNLRAG